MGLNKVPRGHFTRNDDVGIRRYRANSILGSTGFWANLKPEKPSWFPAQAGATGSVAGQIARIKGCRVVGIAGGPDKCAWLKNEAGFDEVIDYKNENVNQRIAETCPKQS